MTPEQREKLKGFIATKIDEFVDNVTQLEGVSFTDHIMAREYAERILQEVEKIEGDDAD